MQQLLIQILISIGVLVLALLATKFLPPIVADTVVSAADARSSSGLSTRRYETLKRLSRHLTSALIIGVACIFVLSLFVNSAGLLTFVGLFSAAFGLGARPLVQDYISGVVFLFEDQYNVGEKVEIFGIEGTVIDINLRTTILRAPSGEIYMIPNGEVRTVRNFGRGEFSLASIHVTIRASQLEQAMKILDELVATLPSRIPDLIEPPRILSEEGALGEHVVLTIFAKAKFTHGVDVRRSLLRVVQDALAKAQINITSA